MESGKLLGYLQQGVGVLLARRRFESGHELRPTQREAFEAYDRYLANTNFSPEYRLKGLFNIATGLGKTGFFSGLLTETSKKAEQNGDQLTSDIVVPNNQTLIQTPANITKFSPSRQGKIGLYGDGHKDLGRLITVMNIDGWDELLDLGYIGSHNRDFLIMDEAHRATSVRRVERLEDNYSTRHTIQIAVTATAHFNKDKSVEKNYPLIYAKRLSEAIRGGEGAAYIQVQPVIIRVEPDEYMRSEEFEEASPQARGLYWQRIKEKAWNEAMLETFRDGHDEHTGDPLSDNETAIFVSRTRQADDIERMLNADPVLQAKAKALGYKGVAIAIHTNGLSPKEQRERFEAVQQRREYLVIVGDSKFKEGFDHPPIKNIIDSPRNSLVDKEQIIGRGGREWYNEKKGRYEGLTVIDTVIYLGADDDDEDLRRRNRALSEVVSVEDILQDTTVLGPAARGYELTLLSGSQDFPEKSTSTIAVQRLSASSFHIRIFDQHGKTQDYTEFELDERLTGELNAVFAEPSRLERESYRLALVKDLRLCLGHLKPPGNGTKPRPFEGNPNVSYLTDYGDIYRLEQEKSAARKDDWVEITEETLKELQAEAERTGLGGHAIFSHMENPPDGLNKYTTTRIVSGEQKSAPQIWVDTILTTYKNQPNTEHEPISPEDLAKIQAEAERTGLSGYVIFSRMENPPDGLTRNIVRHITTGKRQSAPPSWIKRILDTYKKQPNLKDEPISPEDLAKIQAEAERTGLGGHVIFSRMENPPDGLTKNIVHHITTGKKLSAPPSWIKRILDTYKKQPDAEATEKPEPISPEDLAKIQAEAERTGLGGYAIFSHMENPPTGLAKDIVHSIIVEKKRFAPPSWIKAILDTYKKQPDLKEKPEPISPEDLAKMQTEAERTGLGGAAILSRMENPPEGLNKNIIHNITTGKRQSAPPSWIKRILDTYKNQPDAEVTEKLEPISPEDLAKMQAEAERTGLGGTAILSRMENPPDGLTNGIIHGIIAEEKKFAPPSWIKAILDTYKKQPDLKDKPISPEDQKKIQAEVERTGLGGYIIFNRMKNPPDGLTGRIVHNIVVEKKRFAPPSWTKAILDTYKKQPDAKITEKLESITEHDLERLQEYAKKTGLKGAAIFKYIVNPPQSLNQDTAQSIVSGRQKSARRSDLRAIFEAYAIAAGEQPQPEADAETKTQNQPGFDTGMP